MIGHSHAVCLLDALGPWREKAGLRTSRPDLRYGEAFQGWFDSDLKDRAFVLRPDEAAPWAPSELVTCLITGGMDPTLITLPTNTEASAEVGFTPLFLALLDQLHDRNVVVSVMFGNEHAGLQLIDDLAPYDFAGMDGLSSWSWPDPRYQPIDRAHIQRKILSISTLLTHSVAILQQLLPSARVVHILPPPPLEHPDIVPRRELLDELIARYGFVRADLRLKWHFAYCSHVETVLREHGVPVLRPPENARTLGGFLRDELSEGLTHGNGAYGSMVWDALNRLLS